MQAQPQTITQVPPLPPEPHCIVWYKGSPCDVLRQQYQQALQARAAAIIQQQRDLAAQQAKQEATSQLEPQIDQLQKVNADLQQQLTQTKTQMQQRLDQQATAAFKEKAAAHDEGAFRGFAAGFGIALLLLGLVLGVRLLLRKFTIAKREETRAA